MAFGQELVELGLERPALSEPLVLDGIVETDLYFHDERLEKAAGHRSPSFDDLPEPANAVFNLGCSFEVLVLDGFIQGRLHLVELALELVVGKAAVWVLHLLYELECDLAARLRLDLGGNVQHRNILRLLFLPPVAGREGPCGVLEPPEASGGDPSLGPRNHDDASLPHTVEEVRLLYAPCRADLP